MKKPNNTIESNDPFDLNRFLNAQQSIYESVLAELKNGRKRTHWMWLVFPQLDGLGSSSTAKYYAIKSLDETCRYLQHSILGKRLLECSETTLVIEGRSISDIFGYPDDVKLKSSMTLFACAAEPNSVFARILDKYFNGDRDALTLELLEKLKTGHELDQ